MPQMARALKSVNPEKEDEKLIVSTISAVSIGPIYCRSVLETEVVRSF